MKKSYLLLSALFILQVPDSLQKCLAFQNAKGNPNYSCNSIQDFEQENPDIHNVTIYNGGSQTVINEQFFQKATNLNIVLIDDAIKGLSPKTFQVLKNVSRLFVRNKELGTLPRGIFEDLPIELLRLEGNGISDIEGGAFANTPYFVTLLIIGNNLRSVENGIFNDLTIQTLGLSKNRIEVIKRNAFRNMNNLERLNLDGNLLTEFRPEFLMDFGQKLSILFLQNNSFTEIDRNTVKGLDNLLVLNLGANRISTIFTDAFQNLTHLQTLVLSDNRISELHADLFPQDGMPNLSKLYLNYNRLSYLSLEVLAKLRNLQGVRIGGNPWQCPCLDVILNWMVDRNVHRNCDKDYFNGSRPTCVVPDGDPNACAYSSVMSYYYRYIAVNNKSPKSSPCAL